MASKRVELSSHPLIDAYLHELDVATSASDPQEKADLFESVREHITAAMGDRPMDDAGVRAILDRLGAVDEIARDLTEGIPTVKEGAQAPAAGSTSVDIGFLLLFLASLVMFPFFPPLLLTAAPVVLAVSLLRLRASRRSNKWMIASIIGSSLVTVLAVVAALTLFLAPGGEKPDISPLQPEVSSGTP